MTNTELQMIKDYAASVEARLGEAEPWGEQILSRSGVQNLVHTIKMLVDEVEHLQYRLKTEMGRKR